MSEIDKYEAYKNKLQGLCDEHDFVFRLRHDDYPISLTIKPTGGVGKQLSLLADADKTQYISPDASLVFFMKDGELGYKISDTFTIGDALFSKLKNLFKNLHDCWLQYFFRETIENGSLKKGTMPVIDEDEADDDDEGIWSEADPDEENSEEAGDEKGADPDDNIITAATLLVRMENKASISLLQRRLKIGASKAARVMDELEKRGVVGPYTGSTPREVLPSDTPDE